MPWFYPNRSGIVRRKLLQVTPSADRESYPGRPSLLLQPTRNLAAKEQRKQRAPAEVIQEERLNYLREEKRIKAVTVAFSDFEGRLHTLDYDKKFLVKSYDNLTFDGSSIRGFAAQRESDLRLAIDWAAFYWVPADVFGSGKVLVFGEVIGKNGGHYAGDLRGVLKSFANEMYANDGWTLNAANEIEGFLFDSIDAERNFNETESFEHVNKSGYYTRCQAIRCGTSSTRRLKFSARWVLRVRRITLRLPLRNSRSTTCMAMSLQLRIRFSCTS